MEYLDPKRELVIPEWVKSTADFENYLALLRMAYIKRVFIRAYPDDNIYVKP